MKQKPGQAEPRQSMEDLFRNFGIKPSQKMREELRRNLEQEKEKYVAVERVHGKERGKNRDLSR